ncbi:uncharacterized protein LOC21384148 isoform X3 [Morus notabilis]|nr:uncharacterized protein LOC21393491 [Morus notabilis]XP_010089371.2 uncharacterized protein LOC21393492 [Morus notabilis]XP_010107347.2 uncharacterized protein LOC21384148 isoform X1 [Morus notabilis]XP_024028607.1 uncharacterized protein LOC21384148 isoform X2 [Morus notabilis]XP_024028608.1 uncharacterized protein LOC21384148 isoform X3 [Morus notabilis]
MAMSSSAESNITLKLLIDSKEKRVLFAEAAKDFVDFLFTLLSLPVGTVIRLLSTNGMVGTLGKLYQSFESLSDTYIQPNVSKDILLKPNSSIGSSSLATLLSLTNSSDTSVGKKLYICGNCRRSGSDERPGARCTNCSCSSITTELVYVAPPPPDAGVSSAEGGFVKGVVTYMIMDDLEVKPMSTISSITMLNKFNVKEVGALEEKTVSVGIKEGLDLLKASLQTNTVLTDVFLGK